MSAAPLPNRRVEDWKYSDLRNAIDPAVVADAPTASWRVEASGAVQQSEWPAILPHGQHGAMGELAAASVKSGLFLRVGKGERGEARIEIADAGHGRALIMVEGGASLTLRETGTLNDFANIAVDIVLGRNATLTHIRETRADAEVVQVADYSVRLAAGATYRAHLANFGSKLSRTELHIALEGEGAQAHLSGVSVLGDGAHADITTHVTHAVGNTQSTQLFKKVAGGKSRGVYQGRVTVAEGANGADSRQTAKGLILGERAEIDLKPELEIFADDVKCAHGAAVGDLDTESLFYLQSRGIPENEARALLIRAFLGDAVEAIESEDIRNAVWREVDAALENLQ